MYLGLFISASQNLHLDAASGKIDLDVEDQFVPDEIFFLNANCGGKKCDTCAAKIYRFAGNGRVTGELSLARVVNLWFEPDTHRSGMDTARSN